MVNSNSAHKKCIPKSGDIVQAFCQSFLPRGEHYLCSPPAGCPLTPPGMLWKLRKTLYSLKRSPKHFYDLAKKLLTQLGLKYHPSTPCLFTGVLIPGQPPLYLGLYVDDFIYFTESPQVEKAFETRLSDLIPVDWNGDIDYCLGIKFTNTAHPDGYVTITLTQEAFVEHLLKMTKLDDPATNSVKTPYRNGYPVDSIPKMPQSLNQDKLIHYMQTLIGSLNWLSTSTLPDISTITNLLAKYSTNPNSKHLAAAKRII